MERDAATSYVNVVHWDCLAEENGEVGRTYGSTSLSGDLIIPFNSLTEEVVVGWVKDVEDVAAIEARAQANLDARLNPPTISELPW